MSDVDALTHKGAEIVGIPLPKIRHTENEEGGGLYAHDLNAALVECNLKFGARAAGFSFEMGRPPRYKLPTAEWDFDCHPIAIGGKALFIPAIELERCLKGGSPEDTDAKIERSSSSWRSGTTKTRLRKCSRPLRLYDRSEDPRALPHPQWRDVQRALPARRISATSLSNN